MSDQIRVFREVHDVLERQPHGPIPFAGNDQRGDLDDVALTARSRSRFLGRAGDVAGCGDLVPSVRCHHGEQGVLDGEMSHVHTVPRHADAGLTSD